MIVDVEILILYLSTWLAQYAEENGKVQFVVVHGNDRGSNLVQHLCSQATTLRGGLKLHIISNELNIIDKYIDAYNFASKSNGIIVGNINKSFGLYSRDYKKSDIGFIDICPLFDLEYSEIVEATTKLFPNKQYQEDKEYMMLEFCNTSEKLYGIITDENSPHKNTRWPFFTLQQKNWIAKIHQREKRTRHKTMTRPFPKIPVHICNGPGR